MILNVNGKDYEIKVEDNMPLLWVLRDELNLTGTKYGCGVAACGACTVHVDGIAMRSCTLPVIAFVDKKITTIEGIAIGNKNTTLQNAWIEHQVPQCGYCQSGMIMAAEDLLNENPEPTEEDIRQKITNICRCGTYNRIVSAIQTAAKNRNAGNVLLGMNKPKESSSESI